MRKPPNGMAVSRFSLRQRAFRRGRRRGQPLIGPSLSLNFFSPSSLSLVPVSHCLSNSYPPMCCHLQLYTGRHKAQQNIAQMKMPISQRRWLIWMGHRTALTNLSDGRSRCAPCQTEAKLANAGEIHFISVIFDR